VKEKFHTPHPHRVKDKDDKSGPVNCTTPGPSSASVPGTFQPAKVSRQKIFRQKNFQARKIPAGSLNNLTNAWQRFG
jgi:hypothetical protein